MQTIITLGAIISYSFSLALIVAQLRQRKLEINASIQWSFILATALHVATLNYTVFPDHSFHPGFFKISSLIFCVISIMSCFSIIRRLPIESLLTLLIPGAMISLALGEWAPDTHQRLITGQGMISHIVLSILAYSLITLAALQALFLAAQESVLRKHSLNSLFEFLPPLQTMEKLLFEMIGLGFILLTLSIASGFFFLENMFAQHLVHKTALSIIAWLIFGILLAGRVIQGWRGITATKWTISGFIALMLAYFGSKFVLEIILQRL